MQIFFTENFEKENVYIEGEEYRHLIKVLRKRQGDRIHVMNGKGSIFQCLITHVGEQKVFSIIEQETIYPPMPYTLRIGISPTKNPSRFEWFLEKSVEIGISEIFPIISDRTEKFRIKTDRCIQILRSAMKQSMNPWQPVFHSPQNLKTLLNLPFDGIKWMAHETAEIAVTSLTLPYKEVFVLIGPEGGFTPEETELAQRNSWVTVHLGQNRLRTETAGVAVCQIIKTMYDINYI